jgi:hypothetical protein
MYLLKLLNLAKWQLLKNLKKRDINVKTERRKLKTEQSFYNFKAFTKKNIDESH